MTETRAAGEAAIQSGLDAQSSTDGRFADPLIAQILEMWRLRQDFVRAQQRLTLQAKAILRRLVGGDKDEADKLYAAVMKGTAHPLALDAGMAILPLLEAREPLEKRRAKIERDLAKLARQLPCHDFCDQVRGFGDLALAKTVAELGDLTAYHKGITGIWKRAGLAVIDGERQRRVSGEAALLHGYDPERRSVFWNIADPLLKAQGKDEDAGPYRQHYDAEKARFLDAGLTKAHAHNRAMRHMTKQLLADLHRHWLEKAGTGQVAGAQANRRTPAPAAIAAE